MEWSKLTAEEIKKLRDACLLNSTQWIKAARTLMENSKGDCNIAYSLAALALEETAKANLITIRQHSRLEKRDFTWGQKHFDDHIKKLYTAPH